MAGQFSRRAVLIGSGLSLAGCVAPPPGSGPTGAAMPFGGGYDYASIYGEVDDNGVVIPALDLSTINPDVLRREVAFSGPYKPGTIVVRIAEKRLYFVQAGGRAIRYGVGVARAEALNFQGSAIVGRKAVWPHWAPTANMIRAVPKYAAYAGGMPGGIDNPLGARALYLYRGNQDSHFRLHGTTEPESIGTMVSSGCIRLINQDIIDLYNRAPVGTFVTVIQAGGYQAYAQNDAPATAAPGDASLNDDPYANVPYAAAPDGPNRTY